MSRSYKKYPIYKWKDRKGKRAAAKAFRRYKGEIPVRIKKFFRKVYNSWDIWGNWWYDYDCYKEIKRFKEISMELKSNWLDKHLTGEEAEKLLQELFLLRQCFKNIIK